MSENEYPAEENSSRSLQQSDALAGLIEEALVLLAERRPTDSLPIYARTEPLPSLLEHCEALLTQASFEPAPLRLLHVFSQLGEEICTTLTDHIPNLQLATGAVSSPLFGLGPERIEISLLAEANRVALLSLLEGCEARGLDLVLLCDHQIRYKDLPATEPDPTRLLASDRQALGVVLVQHPLLAYLDDHTWRSPPFQPKNLEAYSLRYLAFLDDHVHLPIVTVEDIAASPTQALRRIATGLSLRIPADFSADIVVSGGSSENEEEVERLRDREGALSAEEPLDSPAYLRLCQRLGYDPQNLPSKHRIANLATNGVTPRLPPRRMDRPRSRMAGFIPRIARIIDSAPPGELRNSTRGQCLDTYALTELIEDCLGHPSGFYEAIEAHLAHLCPRDAALLLTGCAAHFASSDQHIHAIDLLAEAEGYIEPGDRPLRLLAAELYLRSRKANLALATLTADAIAGPFQLEPAQQTTLLEALRKHAPSAQSEHGHALLLTKLAAEPPRPLDRRRVMIEIGTTRERAPGQGSTEKLALLCAELGMDFVTVDMDPRNTALARRMFRRHGFPFRAVTDKGEDFLAAWEGAIDYCFLDAYDFDHGNHSELRQSRYQAFLGSRISDEQCHKMHFECAASLIEKLSSDGIICFDDTWTDAVGAWMAKGTTAMPYLLSHGFRVVDARNRAALLVRK